MRKLKYTRIYSDTEGLSHVEDLELDLVETNYAPPAPPLLASAFLPAVGYHFGGAPIGWIGDWHPAPRRQVFVYLKGEIEVEVSDGTSRRLGPGDILLVEDTWGRGHCSWVVGNEEVLAAVIVLGD